MTQMRAILKRQQENTRSRSEEELRKVTERIKQFRKELFRMNWDAAKLDQRIEAFRNVRFGRYLARVFWRGSRANLS